MKTRYYMVHGLRIASELELPIPEIKSELFSNKVDVRFEVGRIPSMRFKVLGSRFGFRIGAKETAFEIQQLSRFLVSGGNRVIVDAATDANPSAVCLFLLGGAMGALMHQRGLMPLHGSAVVIRKHGVAFLGPSGRGKSTLAAAFSRGGYPLLSDDHVVLSRGHNGQYMIPPGFPLIRLKSLAVLANSNLTQVFTVPEIDEKWAVPLPGRFIGNAVPLRAIYFLEWYRRKSPEVGDLHKFDALIRLRRDVALPFFVDIKRREAKFFSWALALLEQVPAYALRRPRSLDRMDELIAIVDKHV